MARVVTEGTTTTLTTVGFDLLWSHLDLGRFPLVLDLLSHGDSFAERDRLLDAARAELVHAGVLSISGTVEPQVARALRAAAAPEAEIDVRGRSGRLRWAALAARTRDASALLVRRGDTITLTPISPASLAAAAVSTLPELAAGPPAQVTGPTAELDRAYATLGAAPTATHSVLVGLGAGVAPARVLVEALRNVDGLTRIGAAERNELGHRVRHPRIVAVVDTAHGRYLSTERAGHDRVPWTTVRPGTADAVTAAVMALVAPSVHTVLR